ncbi:MAG: hypothetical protein MI739_04540 [Bacteroidales bacterium]|nr:hypothetical protein [Bacteroidales bacterium]
MKKNILIIVLIAMSFGLKAQDILTNLGDPAYGVRIKANFPEYTGSWARGFSLCNENNTNDFVWFGAYGPVVNGKSDVSYAFIGKNYYSPYIVFKPDGKVGIGTKTPQSLLAVNGTITSKEVVVTADGWPDYVFASDYNLRSLNEVETYIEQNNHLPDIPSQKEVNEKGINLGNMDAKLLQKIEELTLYIIQQNKKIENMQKQIDELKK